MLRHALAATFAILLLPAGGMAQAIGPAPARSAAFESWEPPVFRAPMQQAPTMVPPEAASRDRLGNAVLGGAIGTVAGLAVCTVISNLANDGTGFSTCTAKGYLLTGGIGFALGFLVGLGA